MHSLHVVIAVVLAILGFSTPVFGAVPYNPDPCTEDFHCVYSPTVTGSVSGPSKVCYNNDGTWTLSDTPINGKKQKCSEPMVDVSGSTTWSWTISGPMTASGSGKTATMKPTKCGSYSVVFTGKTTADTPCPNPSDVTCSYSFTVSTPVISGEVKLNNGSWTLCPTEFNYPKVSITNGDTECSHNVKVMRVSFTGDPTISITGEGEENLNVPAGGTLEGRIDRAEVAQITKRGDKTMTYYWWSDCDTNGQFTKAITVPAPNIDVTMADDDICTDLTEIQPFTIAATGCTKELATWTATLDPGDTSLTATPLSGGPALTPITDAIAVHCPIDSKEGTATLTMNVAVEPLGTVKTKDVTFTVTAPNIGVKAPDDSGCPGDANQTITVTLENNDDCNSELVAWTAEQTGGEPIVLAPAAGPERVPPGGKNVVLSYSVPLTAVEGNTAQIKITAVARGQEKTTDVTITIDRTRMKAAGFVKWTDGPELEPEGPHCPDDTVSIRVDAEGKDGKKGCGDDVANEVPMPVSEPIITTTISGGQPGEVGIN